MRTFEQLHPDVFYKYKDYKKYTRYDEKNNLLEAWENVDGQWIDVTEREQLRIKLAQAAEELQRMKEKESEQNDIEQF